MSNGLPPPLLDRPLEETAQTGAVSDVGVHGDAESQPKRLKLGFDLLRKAGYSGIGGLGKKETGIAEPVAVVMAPESVGLGYVEGQMKEDEEESGFGSGAGAANASDSVVIRVLPAGVSDEEVVALAAQWGGVRTYVRSGGTAVLGLSSHEQAVAMAAHFKLSGLRLGSSDVQCFVAQSKSIDEPTVAPVVPVPAKAISVAPTQEPAAVGTDALSLLLQKLGTQITLPVTAPSGMDEDDFYDFDEPKTAKPAVMSSTASFLQQVLSKPIPVASTHPVQSVAPAVKATESDASDLLSSLSSLRKIVANASVPVAKPSIPVVVEERREEVILWRAICDYEAQEDKQVSFREGDVATLLFRDEASGWSEVDLRGKVGWVPTSYFDQVKK